MPDSFLQFVLRDTEWFMYADTTKSIKAANAEIAAMFKTLI